MDRFTKAFINIFNSIMIAGIMLLLYGLYYLITKGDVLLPFHDNPPEVVLVVYEANRLVAYALMKYGIISCMIGTIAMYLIAT